MRFWGYLGFLCCEGLSCLSVSISSNLFSVSISEICGLCLLDTVFQGDLFLGFSSRLSGLSSFFGRRLMGFVEMGGMPGAHFCLVYFLGVFSFIAMWVKVLLWIWSSMGLSCQVGQAFP